MEDLSRGEHLPLPRERNSINHRFCIGDVKGYLVVGLYPNGEPGELFLYFQEEGTMARGLSSMFGLLISIALQHGVPLTKIIDKLKNTRFEPSGFTKHPTIHTTSSLADYIAQWLELNFINTKEM